MKSRDDGQGRLSRAVPNAGIVNLPALIATWAAAKKAGALQYAYCPKMLPGTPFTQLLSARAPTVGRSVRLSPLYPNQIPTTALFGNVGTTGGAAGGVPLSMTSGL